MEPPRPPWWSIPAGATGRAFTHASVHSRSLLRQQSHTHIYIHTVHIGKGMPTEPTDSPSDSAGKIDFSLSSTVILSLFFFPGEVLGRFLT